MRSVIRQAHSETAFFLRRLAPFLCYLFRLSCTMSIPFRTTSERDIFSSCVHSSSFFTVSLLTRTNTLSVMESSEGGLPAFFGAIVSPLFLVRTLIILLCAQKVNMFYVKTQFIFYSPVCISTTISLILVFWHHAFLQGSPSVQKITSSVFQYELISWVSHMFC